MIVQFKKYIFNKDRTISNIEDWKQFGKPTDNNKAIRFIKNCRLLSSKPKPDDYDDNVRYRWRIN